LLLKFAKAIKMPIISPRLVEGEKMFTGIIESRSKVISMTKRGREYKLTIENPFGMELSNGDSVSVDGVCLTVEKFSDKDISFFVSAVTVAKTIASSYSSGVVVNLERAMRADGRFDGHIVQGHVDCIGSVAAVKKIDKGVEVRFSFGKNGSLFVVERGSVAVNGISLTCAEAGDGFFVVSLIPETLSRTSFSSIPETGKKVNIEFDIIGKYVAKVLGKAENSHSMESLLAKL